MKSRLLGTAVTLLLALGLAVMLSPAAESAGPTSLGPPEDVHATVVGGQQAIKVTWGPPTSGIPIGLVYEVLLDGDVVDTVTAAEPLESVIDDPSLVVGRTYEVGVRSTLGLTESETVSVEQQLYIAPVTTVQSANPSNPLAGREWGVYLGLQDPAVIGWNKLGQSQQDQLAPIAMIHKAKFFGRWITDDQAFQKTKEYIEDTQAGDPEKLTILTLFRMFPWEGEASILKRLPTPAEQAAYRKFVTGMTQAIGGNRVAVVLQPDGFFAWKAFNVLKPKVGKKKALLPSRMLAWTAKTLNAAGPRVSVYVDMGSEDWALGKVAPVAKFLKLCGVKYARGFSLDVSHKNYLDREVLFAQKVAQALAKMGLPGKHAVIDTSDNGQPFAGREINPPGAPYTPPGEIDPCTQKNQGTPCTALGVPPTTDVDNPAWHLGAKVNKAAAKYVDAYLWVSRPWLPDQGAGGTKFSPDFASRLMKTWTFSPYFAGTA